MLSFAMPLYDNGLQRPWERSRQVDYDPSSSTARNGQGRTGLLCGLISLGLAWLPFLSWIPAVAGIVISAKGLSRSSRGDSDKVLARWGLGVSVLGLPLRWSSSSSS